MGVVPLCYRSALTGPNPMQSAGIPYIENFVGNWWNWCNFWFTCHFHQILSRFGISPEFFFVNPIHIGTSAAWSGISDIIQILGRVHQAKNSLERVSRGSIRSDCCIPLRWSTFSKSAWSVRSGNVWNSASEEVKLLITYKAFTGKFKKWLVNTYSCQH